ncbi:hypothetical protein EDD86DRAFT_215632 [Gorgonomyces haynaldii]|nr:hypothetical protein EDD86DRAFT_215632 [Gorgonomyces haynaldii]
MRSFNSSSCKNKTMTQAIRWIAPERYGRKFKMTPLYDVFAFGMTSYQALTSRVPFDEESNEEIVKEWIKQNEIPDRTDGIPDNVWELFVDTIQPSEQRPSVEQIMLRLNPILYGLDGLMLSDTVEETKIDSRIDSKMDWHSTVRDGNLRQIRDMIRSGVDINQKDTFGMTALHYAAEEGHLEIVRLLLQKGALASVSNHGETPLQLAQDNGHSEICKLLLESNAEALYDLGLKHYSQKEFTLAFEYLSKAAQMDHILAQSRLGYMYDYGLGTKIDFERAMHWHLKASSKNHDSMAWVGWLHLNGQGTRTDYEEAKRWFEKSVAGGSGVGWHAIGYLYQFGMGYSVDYAKALECYLKASDLGNAEAQCAIGLLYMKGLGVAKDKQLAKQYFQRSMDAGFDKAKEYLERVDGFLSVLY